MKKLLVLVLPLVMAGCGTTLVPTKEKDTTSQSGSTIEAVDASGRTLVKVSGKSAEIHLEGDATVSKRGKGWSVPEAAKISADADAFKLKDAGGTTMWKIKTSDDKTKVLRGEEDVRCEITTPEPNRFKAKSPSGTELGTARPGDSGGTRLQRGADSDIGTSTAAPSAALAAMFCTEVPAGPRAVIIAELASRGK
ncbi:hypothetical protein GCM10027418_17510 [Mariniluteicoccus endophyticus]